MAQRRSPKINRPVSSATGVTSFNARTGVVVPTAGDYDAFYYTEAEIDATDSLVVHLAGIESITGAKTFTSDVTVTATNLIMGNTNLQMGGNTALSENGTYLFINESNSWAGGTVVAGAATFNGAVALAAAANSYVGFANLSGSAMSMFDSLNTTYTTLTQGATALSFTGAGVGPQTLNLSGYTGYLTYGGAYLRQYDSTNTEFNQSDCELTVGGFGGQWFRQTAPSVLNYTVGSDGTSSYLNASTGGSIYYGVNNAYTMTMNAAGLSVNGTITAAGGAGAFVYDATNADFMGLAHDGSGATISTGGVGGGVILLKPANGVVQVWGNGVAGDIRVYDAAIARNIRLTETGGQAQIISDLSPTYIYGNFTTHAAVSATFNGPTATFTDVLATSYGGITEANLLDKTATEAITGAWSFGNKVNVSYAQASDYVGYFHNDQGSADGFGVHIDTRWNVATNEVLNVTSNSGNQDIFKIWGDGRAVLNSEVATVGYAQLQIRGRYNGYGAGISFRSDTSIGGGENVEMARIVADGASSWNATASTQDAVLNFYTTSDGVASKWLQLSHLGVLYTFDATLADHIFQYHDGTQGLIGTNNGHLYLQPATGTTVQYRAGVNSSTLWYDSAGGSTFTVTHTPTDTVLTCGGTGSLTMSPSNGIAYVYKSGTTGRLRAFGGAGTGYIETQHDDTDANIVCGSSTDLNFSGVSGSYKFDSAVAITGALTATSYGGITEANLVDKSAVETIAALWDFNADIKNTGGHYLALERAGAAADEAGYGQHWILTATPNRAMYTDDTGNDFELLAVSTINGQTVSYTLLMGDLGKTIRFTGATASKVCTIPANASVAFPIGTMIGITNDGSVVMTLAITTDTMTWGKDNTTGTRTLAAGADCVIHKTTATTWKVNGSALVT